MILIFTEMDGIIRRYNYLIKEEIVVVVVTFCGHSDFYETEKYEKKVLEFLEEKVGDEPADMYLGGYGAFDNFAYNCSKKYKEAHPNTLLVFVTPYIIIDDKCNKLEDQSATYDNIIYPSIENKPRKLAIIYRNRYMVEKSDFVIAYIKRTFGGAYKTYEYAKRKRKEIFNLANLD